MKTRSIIILAVLASALCACATQQRQTKTYSELGSAERYVATIQQEANRSGVRVIWLNPPEDRDLSVSYSRTEPAAGDDNNGDG